MTGHRPVSGPARGVTVLDAADLAVIAGRVLGIGTDAALAQMDVAAAWDALAGAWRPAALPRDRAAAAAAGVGLLHALLRHRPFPRDCEQIAVAAGLQFLSLNGWRADLNPPAPAAVVVEALASGQLTPEAATAWLSPRLTPTRRTLIPARGTLNRAERVVTPARRGLIPAGPNSIPARRRSRTSPTRPRAVRRTRRGLSASKVPVRRTIASALLALAIGGVSLLAAACSRGPTAPAGPVPASPASVTTAPASTAPTAHSVRPPAGTAPIKSRQIASR